MTQSHQSSAITLGQLLAGFTLPAEFAHIPVSGLTIDSRHVVSGGIFVALEGVNTHGQEYIPAAIAAGATVILMRADSDTLTTDTLGAIPVIMVPELEQHLSEIAGNFYHHPSKKIPVVGITGTNGKTTCSQLYGQLMALLGQRTGVVGTMGYGVACSDTTEQSQVELSLVSTGMTTPDAISTQSICAELIARDCQALVMEVSSHGLDQGRVAAIAINTAIFTNLTHDHLDYHESMEQYGLAKAKLFTMPAVANVVLNKDDVFTEKLYHHIHTSARVFTYSLHDSSADIYLQDIVYRSSATTAILHTPDGQFALTTSLTGAFNLSNLLAVLGAAYLEGVSFAELVEKVSALLPVSGRMEVIANTLDKHIIVDYAHTPDALDNILAAVNDYIDGDIWCVFGCGGDRDKAKRPLMAQAAERYAQHIIITHDNPRHENPEAIIRDIVAGLKGDQYCVYDDRQDAIVHAITHAKSGDAVVIAGKGHEDYQIVGDQVLAFSDQNAARLALRRLEVAND